MQFESVAAALAMDGHGAYVWFVFAAAAFVAVALLVIPVVRHGRIAREQLGVIRRRDAAAQGGDHAPGA